MPIEKKELIRYIDELQLSDALKANLLQELEADEKRATQFVGQRLRQDDYTRKTTEVADQRKQLELSNKGVETAVNEAVREYASKLTEADGKMNKILKDLESERISRATAEQRLIRVKEQYQLSDEDIPVVNPPGHSQPKPEIDFETRLAEVKTTLLKEAKETILKELMPELMAFPQISALQNDINAEHFSLTGKRLDAEAMAELVKLAPKTGGLRKAWEQQYKIADIRMEKHDADLTAKNRQQWEDEQKAKRSEAILKGEQPGQKLLSTSPVLRSYQDRSKDTALEGNGNGNGNQGGEKNGVTKKSGAERASEIWIKRSNEGQIGKPLPTP